MNSPGRKARQPSSVRRLRWEFVFRFFPWMSSLLWWDFKDPSLLSSVFLLYKNKTIDWKLGEAVTGHSEVSVDDTAGILLAQPQACQEVLRSAFESLLPNWGRLFNQSGLWWLLGFVFLFLNSYCFSISFLGLEFPSCLQMNFAKGFWTVPC